MLEFGICFCLRLDHNLRDSQALGGTDLVQTVALVFAFDRDLIMNLRLSEELIIQ